MYLDNLVLHSRNICDYFFFLRKNLTEQVSPSVVLEATMKKKRAAAAERQRKHRASLSSQKKNWIKKKDRESKSRKRLEMKVIIGYKNVKSQYNAVSKARSNMPKNAKKYATVLQSLTFNTSPRKRTAIVELTSSNSQKRKVMILCTKYLKNW